jgi:ubiquinone/menaquinone biosynthesis C-methylase UbiE
LTQTTLRGPVSYPKVTSRDIGDVRALFNAKASTWHEKYEQGGALGFRVAAFGAILRGRLPPGAKVLDLGCGTGAIAAALSAEGFQVTACDIADEMIAAGKRIYGTSAIEWCLLGADWKRLPFAASCFDAIVSSSVLEYVLDLNGFLIECQRVLKSTGVLIATVPDPRAMLRKLEKVLRPAVRAVDQLSRICKIPRVHSYVTYLECSRNRISLDEWRNQGTKAGFESVCAIKTGADKSALAFLLFRKTS